MSVRNVVIINYLIVCASISVRFDRFDGRSHQTVSSYSKRVLLACNKKEYLQTRTKVKGTKHKIVTREYSTLFGVCVRVIK